MGRVDKFREIRKYRVKCTLVVSMFAILVILGIGVSDYSINTLMKNERCLGIFKIEKKENNYIVIDFMNQKVNIDASYLKKDMEYLYNKLKSVFGK